MKICWDNLEKLRYSKRTGKWYTKKWQAYVYCDNCLICNEPFFSKEINGSKKYCSSDCYHKDYKGDKHHMKKEEQKQWFKINNPMFKKETKEKISEIRKEWHRKNPDFLKGDKNPMFTHNIDFKGDKNPNYGNGDKISGEKHWNWQGGKSFEPYCQIWTKEYKEEIKERDNYQCKNFSCEGKTQGLCVHHIDYNKKNCHPLNLITLCISCNTKANFNRGFWKNYYETILLL